MNTVNVKIDKDMLLNMLVERVKFWDKSSDCIELYEEMYKKLISLGYFDESELDVNQIVDNDVINNTQILTIDTEISKEVYDEIIANIQSCDTLDLSELYLKDIDNYYLQGYVYSYDNTSILVLM